MPKHWADFQYEIYLNGMTGAVPRLPTDLTRLEELTERRLAPGPFGYVAGSAGDGSTARANRAALDRRRIVPRMLRDVHERDLSVEVLGRALPAPLALAPVGVLSIMHPDAEPAAARAAAAQGVPYILSSASSTPMEQVAEAMGDAERWFQLYWPKDREVARSFLDRAGAAGYTALFVTLDTPLLSWRPRDLDQAYLPFLHGVGTANYFSDPAFRAGLAKPVHEDPDAAVMHFVGMFSDPAKSWPDLAFLGRTGTVRSSSRASCTRTTHGSPPTPGWTAWSSPTTEAARWPAPSPRPTRCRAWWRRPATGSPCCSTAVCAPATTSSRPSPSARGRYSWAAPTSTGSAWTGRRASST